MHALTTNDLLAGFTRHVVTVDFLLVAASFLLSFLGGVLTFYVRTDHGLRKSAANCLRYLFPLQVLRLKSCKLDGAFVVVHWLSHKLILAPLLVSNVVAAIGAHQLLTYAFGKQAATPHGAWIGPLVVIGAVLLADFGYYFAHAMMHRFAVLWELHKVHHSAEYLIPISRRRLHPIEEVAEHVLVMVMVGSWLGVIAYAFALPIQQAGFAGVDAYFLLNLLSFYHLRHSHIPMSYGWLERWVISPAQHHVHHSIRPEHLGRNLGTLLACWDRMFGTWAPSRPYNELPVGLMPEDEPQHYDSVAKLYWVPVRTIGRRIGAALRPRPLRAHTESPGI